MSDCPLPKYIDQQGVLNNTKLTKYLLEEATVTVKGHTYIIVRHEMRVNDIFFQTQATDIRYYVKKFVGFTNKDMRKYEIKRYDKSSITTIDLERLRKGKKIQVRGHFKNNCNCEI